MDLQVGYRFLTANTEFATHPIYGKRSDVLADTPSVVHTVE